MTLVPTADGVNTTGTNTNNAVRAALHRISSQLLSVILDDWSSLSSVAPTPAEKYVQDFVNTGKPDAGHFRLLGKDPAMAYCHVLCASLLSAFVGLNQGGWAEWGDDADRWNLFVKVWFRLNGFTCS